MGPVFVWAQAARGWARQQWGRPRNSLIWRLYAMLVPVMAGGLWIGLQAREGLATNASGLIEARQIKEMIIESRTQVLVQDEASKSMVLFPDDASAMSRKIVAFDANGALLDGLTARASGSALPPLIQRLRTIADERLLEADTELSEAAAGGDLTRATRIYRTRFLPARADYDQTIAEASREADRMAEEARNEMVRRNEASLRNIVATLVIGIGISAFSLVFMFRYSVVKPLANANQALAAVAAGELLRRVPVGSRHEIGRLTEGVNAMAASLCESIRGIHGSSRAVAGQAAELHELSQAMEAGATLASDRAGQIAEAGGTVLASVHQTSEFLATVSRSVVQVAAQTGQAAALAGEAVLVSCQTRSSVEHLAESGRVIEAIAETMQRVAFETNILALNASIEAARQGLAGRGFAVVAKQIRVMAEQTQHASAEIARQVETVRYDIGSAVSGIVVIDDTILQLASIAGGIAEEVKRQEAAGGKIDVEVANMVASTSDIKNHLSHVAEVIEQTRAGAQQTRTGAAAVAQAVNELDSLLGHFRS